MIDVTWTLKAIQDRETIYDYIDKINPTAALELDELFSLTISHLERHPELGRKGRVSSTRELVVHENYIAVYRFDGSQLQILRILHAAMQWPS